MTVEIELNGRRHMVAARRDGDRWVVTLDGRELTVRLADIGGRWSLLVDNGSPDVASGFSRTAARSYEVAFEDRPGGVSVVHVDGEPVVVGVRDPRAFVNNRGSHGGDAAHGRVVAPMPGRVVKVLVKPGDVVAARQGVVVVEAMKMENELRAPRAGTVAEVRAIEGTSVDANAVLVVLE